MFNITKHTLEMTELGRYLSSWENYSITLLIEVLHFPLTHLVLAAFRDRIPGYHDLWSALAWQFLWAEVAGLCIIRMNSVSHINTNHL